MSNRTITIVVDGGGFVERNCSNLFPVSFSLTSAYGWVKFTANKALLTSFSAAPKSVGAPDPHLSSRNFPHSNCAH
jgi:hypothetical protein